MRVFRIQDSNGRGPYRPGFSWRWSDANGGSENIPLWWEEIGTTLEEAISGMTPDMHWGCGFRSIEQLRSWFSDAELRRLNRLGFHLACLEADYVLAVTPTQVVFGTREPLNTVQHRLKLGSRAMQEAA